MPAVFAIPFWREARTLKKYSVFAIAREAMRGHKGWEEQWSSPEPRSEYDVIIVGAGGHGLATAYYLATVHGITNVAVLEKGWLGGGNTGRNTTIIRSNYLYDESAGIYDHALKLWDGLSQELNYNVMYSARGVMMLAHNVHDVQVLKRHVHANRLNGIDNEWLTPSRRRRSARRSTPPGTRATPSSGRHCSAAAAPPGTMPSPGVMRAALRRAASTSSRTARSPGSSGRRTER
jgi:heterotetrameric sarcosine oxidase beta subunit